MIFFFPSFLSTNYHLMDNFIICICKIIFGSNDDDDDDLFMQSRILSVYLSVCVRRQMKKKPKFRTNEMWPIFIFSRIKKTCFIIKKKNLDGYHHQWYITDDDYRKWKNRPDVRHCWWIGLIFDISVCDWWVGKKNSSIKHKQRNRIYCCLKCWCWKKNQIL